MVRRASRTDVSEIAVEIDRPLDRARKRNELGGAADSAAVEITGSGATGTLITNNSSGAWYIEHVTVSALGATTGTVAITLDVKDSSGTTHYTGTTEVTSGVVDFGGVPVLTGWTVDYTIEQDDSNTYTVNVHPLLRQPTPENASDDTVHSSNNVDGYEHNALGTYYSGDAGSFSIVQTPTHQRNFALQADSAASGGDNIYSVPGDGLENYPDSDQSFKVYVRSTTAGGGSNTHIQTILFGVDSSVNAYGVRIDWYTGDNVYVADYENGSQDTIQARDTSVDGGLQADHWYRVEVDRSAYTVEMYDTADQSRLTKIDFEPLVDLGHGDDAGIGAHVAAVESGENFYYDGWELTD